MDFPYLFSPVTINAMTLKNRIVMTAMHLGYTPTGEANDRLIAFYKRRAEGGVGFIIVGGCLIDAFGGMQSMISLNDDRFIPGLERLTCAVKGSGAKIGAQLYQAGRYAHSAMIGGREPISSSAVRSKLTGETPRALETDEIPGVQDRFAEAAVRAQKAGFDAVEILGSAGYLISQFLSPITNLREDGYGGDLKNRMRFGLEVVQKVRKAVGPDFPVLMRLAGNDFMEGGNTNRESAIFAAKAEKAGVDMFDVTGGWHETRVPQLTMGVPRKAYLYLAQGIKASVSVPVLASNRINDPCIGEQILRDGEADLVTMARALISDPDLPRKAESGNTERIYHCIACNQGCFDEVFKLQPVTCMVNPMAGKETEKALLPVPKPKKVLVVGGGPAGLKAACTAAERGHRVTLVEKAPRLGGQLLLNRLIPGRGEMLTAAEDLINNLKALNVEILTGKEADLEFVRKFSPDAVIIASGARPIIPEIPGIEGENVIQAWDLLEGKKGAGKKIVILGGNALGLETAIYLAAIGTIPPETLYFLLTNRAEPLETLNGLLNRGIKEVTVLEMTKKAGRDIGLTTRWTIMAELKRLGVSVLTETKAVGVTEEGVRVEGKEGPNFLLADTVVVAAGSESENGLAALLKNAAPEIHLVGDAKSPRNALTAIREGFEAGLLV